MKDALELREWSERGRGKQKQQVLNLFARYCFLKSEKRSEVGYSKAKLG